MRAEFLTTSTASMILGFEEKINANICDDEPRLVAYLLELATCFHKFYDQHRVVDPENTELSAERLGLVDAVRITLANGLKLLGIRAPRKM